MNPPSNENAGRQRVVHTTCNRDCPDACAIVATVEDGKVVRLQGSKDHPVTQGFLCYRTSHFLEQQNAHDRVLVPHVRQGDKLVATTWSSALDRIASHMRDVLDDTGPGGGPQGIFHYRSGGNLGALLGVCDLFWQVIGPVTTKNGDICTGAPDAAQDEDFGGRDSNDVFDLDNAKNIIVWGRNVFTSSPHSVPVLKRAQKGGARVSTIDPVFHRGVRLSRGDVDGERFVQPRPGADFALTMAIARILIDDGGVHQNARQWCDNVDAFLTLCQTHSFDHWRKLADVSDDDVKHLAHALMNGPATVLIGWGLGRRHNGGRTVRAIDALCALTGNIGVAGAGASYYFNRRRSLRKIRDVAQQEFGFKFAPPPREISEPLLAQQLDPKTTRLMWVTAGNPVAMLPASSLLAEKIRAVEMCVVVDTWWSDTAKCADVVLPCATLLERDDVVAAYGHHYIGRARAVVPPAADSKTDVDILRALASNSALTGLKLEEQLRSLGFYDDDAMWRKRFVAPLVDAGVSLSDLDRGAVRSPLSPHIAWKGRTFATRNGRAQLLTTAPDPLVSTWPEDPAFPLVLHSLSHPKSQSSQWVASAVDTRPPPCTVHPNAAAGFRAGQHVWLCSRVSNGAGSREAKLLVRLELDDNQREDVALVPKGGSTLEGRSANVLLDPALTDMGDGAALYDQRVRLRALDDDNRA